MSVDFISVSFCPSLLGQNETLTSFRFSCINVTILLQEIFCAELVHLNLLNISMLKKAFKYASLLFYDSQTP